MYVYMCDQQIRSRIAPSHLQPVSDGSPFDSDSSPLVDTPAFAAATTAVFNVDPHLQTHASETANVAQLHPVSIDSATSDDKTSDLDDGIDVRSRSDSVKQCECYCRKESCAAGVV